MRRALLAYFGFSCVEWASWVVILVYARGVGNATTVGLVAVAQLIPAALLAPGLASWLDRFSRSRAAVVAYGTVTVALGVTAAAMLEGLHPAVVIACAVITNVVIGMVRPAHYSLTPLLATGPAELVAANVVASSSEGLALFIGPAIAGVIMGLASPGMALLLLVAVAATSALAMAAAPKIAAMDGERYERGVAPGLQLLRTDPGVRLPILLGGSLGVVGGAVDVLLVLLAIDVLALGDGGAGYLTAAVGLGALAGGIASSSLVGRLKLSPPLALGALTASGAMILLQFLPGVAVFLALMGLGGAMAEIANRTMLQRLVAIGLMGRVFGLLEAVTLAGLAVGSIVAPVVVGWVGVSSAFAMVGMLLPLVVALGWRSLQAADASASIPAEALAVLLRLDLVAALDPEAQEALARGATVRTVQAGEVVVREGERGDQMWVIESGVVEIIRGGTTVARLGQSDFFGEIALLADVRRIATVIAREPTRLVTINRAGLQQALATDPAARVSLERVAAARSHETLGEPT